MAGYKAVRVGLLSPKQTSSIASARGNRSRPKLAFATSQLSLTSAHLRLIEAYRDGARRSCDQRYISHLDLCS
jgi:hypothetical protein